MAKGQEIQRTWQSKISRALEVKKDWEDRFRVQMARDFFEGVQNPGWPANEWITINKIYSHLKAKLPSLYKIDPFFYVKVKRSFSPNPLDVVLFEQRGKIRQAYLNYLKGELELKDKARLAIQDAHFSLGVLKTHFSARSVENPDAGNPQLADDETQLVGEDGRPLVEPDSLLVDEKYHWSRVHPDDFLWDEDAGTLPDKWHWLGERFTLTEEQAKKDPTISQVAIKTAKLTTEKAHEKEKQQKTGISRLFNKGKADDSGEREVFVGWEIYDLDEKKWLKILEGAEEPAMMPDELPPGTEDHPYSILRFTLRDKSPYPITPISQGLDPQKEFNLSRSRILRHRKRFNRKYAANRSLLQNPEEDLSKLEVGDDGTVIEVLGSGAVEAIQDAPLDQQTYIELGFLNNDITETLGATGEREINTADTATQAALVDNRLEVREGDDLDMVVQWVTRAAEKMDQLVQTHISRDEAVKIVGPQGENWELVRVEDFEAINGEFEYSVNVGSMLPRLPQVERAQFQSMLQVFGGFPQLLASEALVKKVAEMHRIDDERVVAELVQLGKAIMNQQGASPQAQGGGPPNPASQVLGAARGVAGGA
jgi:hypothetical protein